MARFDDDDDDRPRRRRPRDDDDDDRSSRSRRRYDDDDDPPRRRPKKKSNLGLILGIIGGVLFLMCAGGGYAIWQFAKGAKKGFDQAMATADDAQESEASRQNLKRIGLAMHNHNDMLGSLPQNSYGPPGNMQRPLLSWRVHLLPYLQEDALYRQFNLNEPWDSPANKPLLSRMPAVYGSPGARVKAGDGKTFYRGFSNRGGIFEKPQAPGQPAPRFNMASVPDGLSNTIFVIDAGEAIEWTRPDDIDWSPGRPKPSLGGAYPNVPWVMVLMGSGFVTKMRRDVPDQTLRLLIDRQDGMLIPAGWEQP